MKMGKPWRRASRWLVTLALPVFMAACDDRPEGVLSESETIDLLADLQLAQAYKESPSLHGGSAPKGDLQEAVLKAHGISEEQFANTMAYYGRNIDDYYKLFDKVEARIKKKEGKLTGKVQDENQGNDMWPYSRFTYFNRNISTNGMRFSIDPGDFQSGERLEWKLNFTSSDGVDGILGVEYTDGSASYAKKNASGNKKFSIEFQSDTAKVAKRLFGYITMSEQMMPAWADSIQLLRLPFDSVEYGKIRMQQKVMPLGPKPARTEEKKDEKPEEAPKKDSVKETPVSSDSPRIPPSGAPGRR